MAAFDEVINPGGLVHSMGSGLFGSIPTLPPWHTLNYGQEQQQAIQNNLAAAPGASKLANLTEQQILSMLKQVIPNFDEISGNINSNIADETAGKIPKDVQDAIQNSAAGRSLASGTSGSEFSKDLVARDLGLTSLNLTDKGLSSAESWMAATERLLSPAIATYTGMFVTPQEQAGFDVNERNMKFEHDWLGAQLSAMPDPTATGIVGMITGAGDSMRGNSGNGWAAQQAARAQSMPQSSFGGGGGGGMDQWGDSLDSSAYGWETAQSESNSIFGAEGAGTTVGVSGAYDWGMGASESELAALAAA
jgi:hypothetical protein